MLRLLRPRFFAFPAAALAALAFAPVCAAAPAWAQGGRAEAEQALEQALDLTPDVENGRALYKKCVECHGERGWGSFNGTYPQIAGQHRSVIIKQLIDIRLGVRNNPAMLAVVARDTFDAQALADVAAYVSALPMNPDYGIGLGADLARGQDLFERKCSVCHLNDGEGDDEELFPRIIGQNYAYLVRELNLIKQGKRGNARRGMVRRLKRLSAAEIEAVADYISRIKLPPFRSRDVQVQKLPSPG